MKTAIVYYSMSGNTAYAAERMANALDADLIRLEPEKAYPDSGMKKFLWGGKSALMGETPKLTPYTFCADGYDRIVLGTPVWASSIAPPMRTFCKEHAEALREKKVAAFVCCMGGGAEKALERLKTLLGRGAFEETLVLIDPKDRPAPGKDAEIDTFCQKLQ